MKDKFLVFIIGVLLGAVITGTGILIYEKNVFGRCPQKHDFLKQGGVAIWLATTWSELA